MTNNSLSVKERTSDGARRLKVGVPVRYTKTGLTGEAFHKSRTREFGGESESSPRFPRKIIEFGIYGYAIFRVLAGSFDFLYCRIKKQFLPHSTVSVQIWTNYETCIFKSKEVRTSRPPVAPSLERTLIAK